MSCRYSNPTQVVPPVDPTVAETPVPALSPAPERSAGEQHLSPDSLDRRIFKEKLRIAAAESSLQAKMLALMRSFIGTPYATGKLDQKGAEEALVVNLRVLDCWTSVENCLAIALTSVDSTPSYDAYCAHLRELRYWGGTIDGYASRIHYFSGWLLQNEKRGFFKDISRDLGGVRYNKKITYMSDHASYYPKMKDPAVYDRIVTVQERLSAHEWYYIPKHKVAQIENLIEPGDLIVCTSSRGDLDVEHEGLAVRQNGRIWLLHASSTGSRVRMAPRPLPEYLQRLHAMSGIMVARFQ